MRSLGARIRSFLGRKSSPNASDHAVPGSQDPNSLAGRLEHRIRSVSESLLDNERLTADLDDSAAQELIDWGLATGRWIVQSTATLEDDEQAQEAMYPRLRATRRLMQGVNRWIATTRAGDASGSRDALRQIVEEAQIVYGPSFLLPSEARRTEFLETQTKFLDSPPRLVANLLDLLGESSRIRPQHRTEGEPFTE